MKHTKSTRASRQGNPSSRTFDNDTEIQSKMERLKWKQKQSYDNSTETVKPLINDDVVRIQEQDARSRKATVFWETGPRSYEVRTKDGDVFS